QSARASAKTILRAAEDDLDAAFARRNAAGAAERKATETEAEVNRRWREAAAELDRLREHYADEDRARGDLDRRIADAETLLRTGHDRDPAEAVGALAEDETAHALERRAELVSRRLALLGRVNLLATGEFEARPGRKRVRRISLLSGGERALTAMAFLFAIFRARPSPFYLLDEVEPALDDVNLHRFLRLIESFARDSQVLVVTHQKRTMEMAEMLYGVSMAKDGTSRVVCQRFEDERRQTAAPFASAEPPVVVPEADPVR